MPKITKKLVDGLRPDTSGKDLFAWDTELRGFGVRVKPTGAASFLIQYRTPEMHTRRLVIGKVGTLTPEEARKLARTRLATVADGADPSADRKKARDSITIGELCDAYMAAARAGLVTTRFRKPKRKSTVNFDEGRISRHIKPLIGCEPAKKLTRSEVQRMADAIAEGKTAGVVKTRPRGKAVVTGGAGTSARVVGLLGGIWTWAEKRGLVEGANPAHGVETATGNPRNRVLSPTELEALGKTLRAQADLHPGPVAAVLLIALTGLRKQEACGLRWDEFDELGQCLRLASSKTGQSTRPLGRSALMHLKSLSRNSTDFVFPNKTGKKCADLKKGIEHLFDSAGLHDARSHDLRRTFASVAADEGYGDATIAELLGHAQRSVTAKHYIRRPDSALIAAADRVSSRIAAAMGDQTGSADVVLMRRTQVSD